jgi:hypothetical protein
MTTSPLGVCSDQQEESEIVSTNTGYVIAPPGRSIDRAREQIQGAKDMGARMAVVNGVDDEVTPGTADFAFPIQATLPEEITPLVYGVPGEILAVALCELAGKAAFEFISHDQFVGNMRQIRQSRVL